MENAISLWTGDQLETVLANVGSEMKEWTEQDEDVLSYALFPQVAVEFFKYRQAQETRVDPTAADSENGAYPV